MLGDLSTDETQRLTFRSRGSGDDEAGVQQPGGVVLTGQPQQSVTTLGVEQVCGGALVGSSESEVRRAAYGGPGPGANSSSCSARALAAFDVVVGATTHSRYIA